MTGTLGLFSLVDLFQLLSSSSRTGRLNVNHPEGKAKVYFDKGQVVHAEFAGHSGQEAVFLLFSDERGSFAFQVGVPSPQETIKTTTENLMLEAIRKVDEGSKANIEIPDDMVAVYVEDVPSASTLSLQPQEVSLLKHINGQRTLADLAKANGISLNQVKQIVDRLVKVGVLQLKNKSPRTARLVTRLVRGLAVDTVALDSNIYTQWASMIGHEPSRVVCRLPNGNTRKFHLKSMDNVGPYILFTKETLALANLAVDDSLLVKPLNE